MPRTCTVCRHPSCAEINRALVAGSGSYRDIARQYALSKDALYRHRAEHIPAELAKAANVRELLAADDLLGQVRALQSDVFEILESAMAPDDAGNATDPHLALRAAREARENIRLLSKAIGRIRHGGLLQAGAGVVTSYEVPSNDLEPSARVAAIARLVELGQLPPSPQPSPSPAG